MEIARREFLRHSMVLGVAAALGDPPQQKRRGERLRVVPFVEEGGSPIGQLLPGSHQGRLVVDLAKLDQEDKVLANDDFFIRTRYPDQLTPPNPWTLEIAGRLEQPFRMSVFDLAQRSRSMGRQLLECSGNGRFRKFGLLSVADWGGVPATDLLEDIYDQGKPTSEKHRVLVEGFDAHSDVRSPRSRGASWIFTPEQLEHAYFATEMNDRPLPKDHGEPIRLIVPNWYGCCCIKWVRSIRLVDEEAPSTAQMREFAGRTHQDGVPELARDFKPASMDFSAMVTRVEQGRDERGVYYVLTGIAWGGERKIKRSELELTLGEGWAPVDSFQHDEPSGWSFWEHRARIRQAGKHSIALRVSDESVATKRLDKGFYTRHVELV